MGLTAALATAGRSLQLFSAGIEISGQNISNAANPDYIRETLRIDQGPMYSQGGLLLGTGAVARGVQQQIDLYLESRVYAANADAEYSAISNSIYKELEAEVNELGANDLSTALNSFLAAINDVANEAESTSVRGLLVDRGADFANAISSLRARIDQLRTVQQVKVNSLVNEANTLIDRVSELNGEILHLEASVNMESQAGALRSERYAALQRLSEIVPIDTLTHASGFVEVRIGTEYVILPGETQHLNTVPEADRGVPVSMIELEETNYRLDSTGGELGGLIRGRDEILGEFIDQLDTFTANLIFEFNKIHSSGEGLKGFTDLTSASRVNDATAALNAAGLDFTPNHGSFELKVTNSLTGLTETSTISVDLDGIGTDTTLTDLRDAITAAHPNLTATITTDGRLKLETTGNYEFRFANDDSGTLAALGLNTFFTGTDSSNIAVNSVVLNDEAYFASSQGGGPSDSSNALALAGFVEAPVEGLSGLNLDEFYGAMISDMANGSSAESTLAAGFASFRESLTNQRAQISGVNLDEEAIRVIEFQRAYQSAARIISTVDELMQVLLSL